MTSNFQDTNPKKFYTKQQCTECGDCAEAFPRHLWPDLCEMVRNNVNSMHEQWQLAERAFSLGREDRPYKASLGRQALVGVKMTLNFFFLTLVQFFEKFGKEAADVGVKIYSLLDYDRRSFVKGVLIHAFECANPFQYRHVQFYNNTFLLEGEQLLAAEETLRPTHASDAMVVRHEHDIKMTIGEDTSAVCIV